MPLNFDDESALDKLSRCKQQALFMDQEVNHDAFIRFAYYVWYLHDWILFDPRVPKAAKDEVLSWNKTPPCPQLCICKDIINSGIHMITTRYYPPTADASSQKGFGIGRYGYGVGKKQITITMKDGRVFDALEVTRTMIEFWEGFFARHYPA
jgi:hypothetical protein